MQDRGTTNRRHAQGRGKNLPPVRDLEGAEGQLGRAWRGRFSRQMLADVAESL